MKIVIKKEDYGKRDELHVRMCEKYKHTVIRNRKKYTRKRKHRDLVD